MFADAAVNVNGKICGEIKLTFDFRKNKTGEYKTGWVDVGNRRIYDVVV